jgi:hypothetical protein
MPPVFPARLTDPALPTFEISDAVAPIRPARPAKRNALNDALIAESLMAAIARYDEASQRRMCAFPDAKAAKVAKS